MGIKAYQQIEAGTVVRSLLAAAVLAELDQVPVNTAGIQAINDARGAATGNGIATLVNGVIPTTQLPPVAISEYKGSVADASAMTAVTAENGDFVYREDTSTHWILGANNDPTDVANWREFTSPDDGVVTLSNSSGTITGQQGSVTLADVAFSGAASDVTGLSAIATSGSSNDAGYDGSVTNYLTGVANAGAALTALDGQLKTNADNITTATATAVNAATMVKGSLTGTKDGSNPTFAIAGVDVSKPVFVYRDGIEQLSSGFATRSGSSLTTVISAPESDEAMVVYGYPE